MFEFIDIAAAHPIAFGVYVLKSMMVVAVPGVSKVEVEG